MDDYIASGYTQAHARGGVHRKPLLLTPPQRTRMAKAPNRLATAQVPEVTAADVETGESKAPADELALALMQASPQLRCERRAAVFAGAPLQWGCSCSKHVSVWLLSAQNSIEKNALAR